MKKTLDRASKEIAQYRGDIEKKLLEFSETDLLFFWSEKKDLFIKQQSLWQPVISWAEDLLNVKIEKTDKLDTPDNSAMSKPLQMLFSEMSDKEFACYYAAALNMKSVLLALAMIKGKINAKTAGELSYLEELWQNEKWGSDNEAVKRRNERCSELDEIERYLKK